VVIRVLTRLGMFWALKTAIFDSSTYIYIYIYIYMYKGKSLNNRNFIITFFTRVLTEIVCVLFFDTVPLLRNTLGPPVHKLADAL